MQALYEKYRPQTLDDVIGQPKAVATVRRLIERGAGGSAVWLSGSSGSGKTSMARIIAQSVADQWSTVEYDSADQLTQGELDAMSDGMHTYSMGKGGRAYVVNEAHSLRKPIVRQLLGILERLPAHVVIVFTTTREGEDKLFEDDIDASPLLSRCLRVALTTQGLARAFAENCQRIARAEGLDGQPLEAYVKLMQRPDVKNNHRAALQLIQAGAMLGGAA